MPTKTRTTPFDGSFHLRNDVEAQLDVLNDALDSGSAVVIGAALGDIARARGMTDVAKKVGMTRAGLYRALSSDGNAKLSTVASVLDALGIKLKAEPVKVARAGLSIGKARKQRVSFAKLADGEARKVAIVKHRTSTKTAAAKAA
jgi:probable addiction module antidote protein